MDSRGIVTGARKSIVVNARWRARVEKWLKNMRYKERKKSAQIKRDRQTEEMAKTELRKQLQSEERFSTKLTKKALKRGKACALPWTGWGGQSVVRLSAPKRNRLRAKDLLWRRCSHVLGRVWGRERDGYAASIGPFFVVWPLVQWHTWREWWWWWWRWWWWRSCYGWIWTRLNLQWKICISVDECGDCDTSSSKPTMSTARSGSSSNCRASTVVVHAATAGGACLLTLPLKGLLDRRTCGRMSRLQRQSVQIEATSWRLR